jgi:biopolymer transport protein ExbB/TolQ
MSFEIMVWVGLIGLGWFTVYLAVERWLYLWWHSEVDEHSLDQLAETWRQQRRISAPSPEKDWGWLGLLVAHAGTSPTSLCKACYGERREVNRFAGSFLTVASLASSLGLLGTFLALKQNSAASVDPAQVLGLGIGASITGVMIAIVATFCDWVIRPRIVRLRGQQRIVLEVLNQLVTPPDNPPPQESGTPLVSPTPDTGNTGRAQHSA